MAHTSSPQLLANLQKHLQELAANPSSTLLDVDLLEQVEIYVSTPQYLSGEWQNSQVLFQQVAQVLPTLQQDPAPLVRLILKLAAPFTYEQISDLDLSPALALEAKPFHDLSLTLLGKATVNATSAEQLASKQDIVKALVRLWLCTEDTGIASKAGKLLLDLLAASQNAPASLQTGDASMYGRGPMWKRLFEDADIYRLFFAYCSFEQILAEDTRLNKKEKTIAQARLMEWLPKVGALDWDAISKSQVPGVEQEAGLSEGQGLLDFASMRMVDYEDDVLMHMSLIAFYADLIAAVKKMAPCGPNTSVALQYLIDQGLHSRTIDYWLRPGNHTSLEHTFLAGPSANYLSVYLTQYPDHFEASNYVRLVRDRINTALDPIGPNQWAHGQSPKHELHVLSSLPRTAITPSGEGVEAWRSTPLSRVPFQHANADALHTLATVFHGPLPEPTQYPAPTTPTLEVAPSSTRRGNEESSAMELFTYYFTHNPTLFRTLVTSAQTLAMKDVALASINLMKAIATSNWPAYASPSSQPSIELLLASPHITPHLLPYLLSPSSSMSNLVGGGRGDVESAAYAVANAKFDLLQAIVRRLQPLLTEENPAASRLKQIDVQLKRRVSEGVWGAGAGVGARIGTLEL